MNHNCLAVLHFLPRCIGFHCEVGKSYYAGHDKIPHQNVDSRQHYRSKRFGLEDISGPRIFCLMTKCEVSNGQKSDGRNIGKYGNRSFRSSGWK